MTSNYGSLSRSTKYLLRSNGRSTGASSSSPYLLRHLTIVGICWGNDSSSFRRCFKKSLIPLHSTVAAAKIVSHLSLKSLVGSAPPNGLRGYTVLLWLLNLFITSVSTLGLEVIFLLVQLSDTTLRHSLISKNWVWNLVVTKPTISFYLLTTEIWLKKWSWKSAWKYKPCPQTKHGIFFPKWVSNTEEAMCVWR